MKKINSLLSILLITVLLAACGTTTGNEKANQPDSEIKNAEQTEASGNTTATKEELKGTSAKSESQNYSITLMDGFELTGEEPNKDMLFNTENDAQSLRIETFDSQEVNLDEVTNNLVDILKASNENGNLVEISDENQLPNNEGIKEVKGYQIDTPEGMVSGYTFEREGLIIKLTVFDTNENPALDKFVKMAETIKKSASAL
jgi:PBP1b-binding outer membrane lipoprotein LpoB